MAIEDFVKDHRSPLASLLDGRVRQASEPFEVPGIGTKAVFWVLTAREDQAARKAAFDYLRAELRFSEIDLAYDESRAKNEAVAAFTLAAALRSAELPETPFATNGKEVLERLGIDAIAALFRRYNEFLTVVSGWLQVEDLPAEVDKLVGLVKKGMPLSASLSYYDMPSLRGLAHTMATRLASAPTSSSSDASSPNG